MVNKRSKRIRRTKPRRSNIGKLNQIASNAAVRCRLPRDPPTLSSSPLTSHILPLKIKLTKGDPTIYQPAFGEIGLVTSHIDASGKPQPITASTKSLANSIASRFGFNPNVFAEYALAKVAYWGPTCTQLDHREMRPSLTVDDQTFGGGITVNDVGSASHRACLGITIPFKRWYSKDNDDSIIRLSLDLDAGWDDGHEMGIIYITMMRRSHPNM